MIAVIRRYSAGDWWGAVKRNPYARDKRIWTGALALAMVIAMVGAWNAQSVSPIQNVGLIEASTNVAATGFAMHSAASSGSTTTMQAPLAMGKMAASAQSAQRMVIEQGSLSITLPKVQAAEARITQMAIGDGGFVESSVQSTGSGGTVMATMTVRVPATDFSSFLNRARTLGTVTGFSQTGQDVTRQYSGLTQQIAELRSESAAYTRLFNKAQSMKDMLQIEQALSQVNSQISALSSQQHSLRRSVQLATVNVSLATTTFSSSAPPPIVTAWNQTVGSLGQSALSLFTMIAWGVPWAILFFLILLCARVWFRIRKNH